MQDELKLKSTHITYGFTPIAKSLFNPWVKQVHGTDFYWVNSQERLLKEADAVLTSLPQTKIYVSTADCLPVLLAGENTIAAIHSGWRGTMKGVVPATLKAWPEPIEKTYAILGPALGPCCFEVKEDFIENFKFYDSNVSRFLENRSGKVFFDMPRYVLETQLNGIKKENLRLQFSRCTYCSKEALPSFRRNKSTDPQIQAWISVSN